MQLQLQTWSNQPQSVLVIGNFLTEYSECTLRSLNISIPGLLENILDRVIQYLLPYMFHVQWSYNLSPAEDHRIGRAVATVAALDFNYFVELVKDTKLFYISSFE